MKVRIEVEDKEGAKSSVDCMEKDMDNSEIEILLKSNEILYNAKHGVANHFKTGKIANVQYNTLREPWELIVTVKEQ